MQPCFFDLLSGYRPPAVQKVDQPDVAFKVVLCHIFSFFDANIMTLTEKCGSGDSFERYVWGNARPVARVAAGEITA